MLAKRHLTGAMAVAVAAAAVVLVTPGAALAYDPISNFDDAAAPYAQPGWDEVPKRGCATIAPDPAAPPSGIPAVQVIYAWHTGNGDHYSSYVEQIAKKVDRVDWILDESSNYDQHINFSCTHTPDSTYNDYAQALVAKVQISNFNPSGPTNPDTVRADLMAAGFTDANRYYLVFADFDSGSNGGACPTTGGIDPVNHGHCSAVLDEWYSAVAAHELFHVFGPGHAFSQETDQTYQADIMGNTDYWQIDQDFNTYYDPSEITATFFDVGHPATTKRNIAAHAALTVPTCCDPGYSNDLLTAQERTLEADAPWGQPTGFALSGAGWFQITPGRADNHLVSQRYYDGRRSLSVNVQAHGEAWVSVTRKPPVTAGSKYKFFARLTTSTAGQVKLRISWYNAASAPIGAIDGPTIAVDGGWEEHDLTAVAPAGATQAQLSVISPAGQNFTYLLDTLNFNHCNSPRTGDGCRNSV